MEVGSFDPVNPSMRVVNIYVAGTNISEFDNTVYIPQFVTSIRRASEALKQKIDYAKYDAVFFDHSIEEAYRLLAQDEGELFSACRVLDFGATTDGSLSFLIPRRNRLYLASQVSPGDEAEQMSPLITEITAYEMIRVMELTAEALGSSSS
ncbi:hypothetical protein ACFJIX_26905 [Roseateles sp. UC29_93]|uniref:hypothetical protein n=1 Tax=Roseateles sp. UC29_93 TaxID=3350177 RepID=UPI00366C21CA